MLLVLLAAGALQIVDTSQGCFHHKDASATLTEHANSYSDGTRVVSKADVRRLRQVLEESETKQSFDPAALGITPESVKLAHDTLVKAAQWKPGKPLPAAILEAHITYDSIVALAKRRVDSSDRGSTTNVRVAVHLNDDVVVSSDHLVAFMLPWHVTMHGRSWDTYSTNVSRAVATVLGADANHKLITDVAYWPAKFWDDIDMRLSSDVERDAGNQQLQKIEGYESVLRRYDVTRVSLSGDNLWLGLKPKEVSRFDSVLATLHVSSSPSLDALLSRGRSDRCAACEVDVARAVAQ